MSAPSPDLPQRHRRYTIGAHVFDAPRARPGLHLVATPIGNLGDITIRALETLAGADTVLCEDTRVTSKLFQRFGLRTPLKPYHDHNAQTVRPAILAELAGGASIALVSDAGTPLVSDPGYKLVHEAIGAGVTVEALPGASAVLAGLSVSGLPTDRFLFAGFLPPKSSARRAVLEDLKSVPATLVFFDTAPRLADTLADVAAVMGARGVVVARELTKLHEEVLRGTAAALAAEVAGRASLKGEICLLIAPPADDVAVSEADVDAALAAALETAPAAQAAALVAKRFGLVKRDVYARALALKGR
ncbi:MAG: 16S rRNA (cytidine(1402)-2'-O)-methyltransferase [Hyphomicrobiales bacterium]